MASINSITPSNNHPNPNPNVLADYCFNNCYFELRTYKSKDKNMSEGVKQHIELDRKTAADLVLLLNKFINQKVLCP